MSTCILVTGTITLAMKARKTLLAHAIPAEASKLTSHVSGCLYGIRIPCVQIENAKRILRSENLPFEEYHP